MAFLIVRRPAFLIALVLAGLLLPVCAIARSDFGPDPEGWKWLPDLPELASGHQAAVAGRSLVVVGGRNRLGKIQRHVFRAPLHGNGTYKEWKREADTPFGIAGFAMVVAGKFVYASGGMRLNAKGEDISPDVWMADVADDGSLRSWRRTEPLPVPLFAHSMVAYGRWLYILGGMGPEGHLNSVFRGEIAAGGKVKAWEDVTALPTALAHAASVAVGDYLVVAGGQSPTEGKTLVMPTVYVGPFDKEGGITTWYLATSRFPGAWLGYGRCQQGLVVWRNNLFAIGGQDASWFNVPNIASSSLDPATGDMANWGVMAGPKDMPQITAVAATKDVVYLVAGMVEGRVTSKVLMGRFMEFEREDTR